MVRKKVLRWLAISVLVFGLLIAYARYRWTQNYPYGWSHCCDKQLILSLMNYAETHGGRYPAGEATPEASLSLLYPDVNSNVLRGRIIPEQKVEAILSAGGKLTPATCGWQYVEGLSPADDPNLALFWCKEPLGHNGQLLDGFHVFTVTLEKRFVPLEDWDDFLADQEELRAVGLQEQE